MKFMFLILWQLYHLKMLCDKNIYPEQRLVNFRVFELIFVS